MFMPVLCFTSILTDYKGRYSEEGGGCTGFEDAALQSMFQLSFHVNPMRITQSGGSFFFEPPLQPKVFSVGDIVQLVGLEMQQWNGSPQLSGKNVHMVQGCAGP